MAQARCMHLTAEQTAELEWVRDHHQKAYMRERAAAILKVASGLSMLQVALHGLLKRTVQQDSLRFFAGTLPSAEDEDRSVWLSDLIAWIL